MFRRILNNTIVPGRINKVFLSTLSKTKSFLEYGVQYAQKYIITALHGPTADEITSGVDLSGKTCLITGANSGIGLEMARCLAARDCLLLMACRNTYAAGLGAKYLCDTRRLRLFETNLASLRSVKRCCDEIVKADKQIDVVILNAAVFGLPWTLTADMLETTFQVNYLSQIYMLMNIEKVLAPDARVVFMSSESHRHVNWSFHEQLMPTEDMVSLPKHKYTSIKAYNISKLCGLLAMRYLAARWVNTPRSVFSAHPGTFVRTRLTRNWWPYELLYSLMVPFAKNINQAASTPLYCATSPDLKGLSSLYFKDCRRIGPSDLAQDSQLAFRIHDLTVDLIRERTAFTTEELKDGLPVVDPPTVTPIEENLSPTYS